jgi:hypothetical protein
MQTANTLAPSQVFFYWIRKIAALGALILRQNGSSMPALTKALGLLLIAEKKRRFHSAFIYNSS